MKRIIALICLIAVVLPLYACSPSLAAAETENTQTREELTTEAKTEEKGEIVYPEGFSAGFGRVDITGTMPVDVWDGEGTVVRDPLYLTVVAVCDGENVALLMNADARGILRSAFDGCVKVIEKKFGIPRENILINHTHSHHAPTIGNRATWLSNFMKKLPLAVEDALRDLAPAEAFSAVGHTKDLTFVRRYLLENGTWETNATAGEKPVAHESEADNEVRTVRFERGDEKDILMTNYQTHYMGGIKSNEVSADIFGEFRKQAEKELDCHFAYFSGSGGNLNCNSPIAGERKYNDFESAGEEFVRAVKEALASEAPVATGKIVTKTSVYEATVNHDDPERVAQAKEIQKAGRDTAQGKALIAKYGFISKYAATAVITRSEMGEKKEVNFFAVTFGDIAFSTAPCEQFDTNGQEVRAASPFPVTFTLSMTNESNGYVPSALAFEHYSYEVSISRFIPGTGEEFVREQLRLLNECKTAV